MRTKRPPLTYEDVVGAIKATEAQGLHWTVDSLAPEMQRRRQDVAHFVQRYRAEQDRAALSRTAPTAADDLPVLEPGDDVALLPQVTAEGTAGTPEPSHVTQEQLDATVAALRDWIDRRIWWTMLTPHPSEEAEDKEMQACNALLTRHATWKKRTAHQAETARTEAEAARLAARIAELERQRNAEWALTVAHYERELTPEEEAAAMPIWQELDRNVAKVHPKTEEELFRFRDDTRTQPFRYYVGRWQYTQRKACN